MTLLFSALLSVPLLAGMLRTAQTVHEFSVKSIDGKDIRLSDFKGKKLLIVNVASECGYTKQYKDLETLYKQYGSKLVVLGFPANNFGGQEPGTDAEIKNFCQTKFQVSFPMFSKISVKGKDCHPLYQFLSDKNQNGQVDKAPSWNFCKYLVDENGKVIRYFASSVNPLDKEITDLL
jgi:glutathione peroxidase